MDANGLKFWMLADERDWRLDADSHLRYDAERRHLRLASERPLPPHIETRANAAFLLGKIPQTLDAYATRAFYDEAAKTIVATGVLPSVVKISAPLPQPPTDLAMGFDGVLYLADESAGQIVMFDQRDRWDAVTLPTGAFAPWRLAADPEGGVWALDRTHRRIARVTGQPLPRDSFGSFAVGTVRPCEENSDPPRLKTPVEASWPLNFGGNPAFEEPVAIACSPQGRVAVLTWPPDAEPDGQARVHCLESNGQFSAAIKLEGARYPYSLAWVSDDRIAILLTGMETDAPVYDIGSLPVKTGDSIARPVGDIYPLRRYDSSNGPFLHGVTLPPHYPQISAPAGNAAPLHYLSLPSHPREAKAAGRKAADDLPAEPLVFDSGSEQTVWHRLYLEASIPPKCGVIVRLAAVSAPGGEIADEDWNEHLFGEQFAGNGNLNLPRGAWMSLPSELPFHPGLLHCPPEPNRAGLFTALIQRARRRVRTLRGRYLRLEVVLQGDGRTTPELAALRAYGSRFSYVNRYLPEIYQESEFGPDADQIVAVNAETGRFAPSTPADFLERFVDNFEGVLTPLEDRIANAHLLTDPEAAPEEALEWLGSWIGMSFDPAFPTASRRRLLQNATDLYKYHGTAQGLKLALDIVTGGSVTGGEIIVLEDFRLRRVFATILGANLADETDPLLGGVSASANSFVGDTLLLGDEMKREFLALFDAEVLADPGISPAQRAREAAAVAAFFDRLAHRITVLVHREVEPQNLGLIRRVVELETPAHVRARIAATSYPFLVGVASLVGVDTYLGRRPQPRPVQLGRSQIGVRDFLLHPPSLDPRLKGGVKTTETVAQRPIAKLEPGKTVEFGETFTLDASGSTAPPGERITHYHWTLVS